MYYNTQSIKDEFKEILNKTKAKHNGLDPDIKLNKIQFIEDDNELNFDNDLFLVPFRVKAGCLQNYDYINTEKFLSIKTNLINKAKRIALRAQLEHDMENFINSNANTIKTTDTFFNTNNITLFHRNKLQQANNQILQTSKIKDTKQVEFKRKNNFNKLTPFQKLENENITYKKNIIDKQRFNNRAKQIELFITSSLTEDFAIKYQSDKEKINQERDRESSITRREGTLLQTSRSKKLFTQKIFSKTRCFTRRGISQDNVPDLKFNISRLSCSKNSFINSSRKEKRNTLGNPENISRNRLLDSQLFITPLSSSAQNCFRKSRCKVKSKTRKISSNLLKDLS